VISGTAAVVIVPLSALTQQHGIEYMTLCILVSAIIQGLFGIFRLAKTADLVSEQVLSGFLNGLGLM
jgi:SulP family sulfate permease